MRFLKLMALCISTILAAHPSLAGCLPDTDGDATVLLQLISKAQPDCMARAVWHEWVDRAMRSLTARVPRPAGFTESLIGLAESPSADPVVRNYAVQHLTMRWMHRVGREERTEIIESVQKCLTSRDATLAGTALLALQRIEAAGLDVRAPTAHPDALAVIRDGQASQASRATAIQVLAAEDPEAATEVANTLANLGSALQRHAAAFARSADVCPTCPKEEDVP